MARTMRTRSDVMLPSPRLSILTILKRRKKSLKTLVDELGIVTLASMRQWCNKFGAAPPTDEEWEREVGPSLEPPSISDPTDGIIVITPDDIVDDNNNDDDDDSTQSVETVPRTKCRRKRKFQQD